MSLRFLTGMTVGIALGVIFLRAVIMAACGALP